MISACLQVVCSGPQGLYTTIQPTHKKDTKTTVVVRRAGQVYRHTCAQLQGSPDCVSGPRKAPSSAGLSLCFKQL